MMVMNNGDDDDDGYDGDDDDNDDNNDDVQSDDESDNHYTGIVLIVEDNASTRLCVQYIRDVQIRYDNFIETTHPSTISTHLGIRASDLMEAMVMTRSPV